MKRVLKYKNDNMQATKKTRECGWLDDYGYRKGTELSCTPFEKPALNYYDERTGNRKCQVEIPPVSALETTGAMSWEMWSYLIDIKLFGRETPFSNIPQPLDL